MTIGAIGDDRISGFNTFWFQAQGYIANWVSGSPPKSLTHWLGPAWEPVNRAGKDSLISQALDISHFAPDIVVIQYGQDQVCQGVGDPLSEIEMAVDIFLNVNNRSFIVLMPAPRLERVRKVMAYHSTCFLSCAAASDERAELINLGMEMLAKKYDRVIFLDEMDHRLVYDGDFNLNDCRNPSMIGAEVFAYDTFTLMQKYIKLYRW